MRAVFPRLIRPGDRAGCAPGLSLVEVLVAVFILMLLAGLLLPAVGRARHRGLLVKTEAMIAGVETALSLYENDFGDFPFHEGPAGEIIALLARAEDESPLWRGPYLRFRERDIVDGELLDPWGEPFYYEYPQDRKETTPFLFYSGGPDRIPLTERDIGNW